MRVGMGVLSSDTTTIADTVRTPNSGSFRYFP